MFPFSPVPRLRSNICSFAAFYLYPRIYITVLLPKPAFAPILLADNLCPPYRIYGIYELFFKRFKHTQGRKIHSEISVAKDRLYTQTWDGLKSNLFWKALIIIMLYFSTFNSLSCRLCANYLPPPLFFSPAQSLLRGSWSLTTWRVSWTPVLSCRVRPADRHNPQLCGNRREVRSFFVIWTWLLLRLPRCDDVA